MFTEVDFDIGPLNQFVAKIEARIISKEAITLEDAIKSGIEFENNSLEYQYRALIQKSNPELGELVSKLGTSDQEHIDRLSALAGYLDK